jgi:hypothetical protein
MEAVAIRDLMIGTVSVEPIAQSLRHDEDTRVSCFED